MTETVTPSPRSIDFLSRTFRTVGGVTRTADGFRTTTPWAIARYGPIRLSRGWWTLVSDGEDEDLEVRVRDDTGLIFVCRPSRLVGAVNLYVGQSTLAEIDLVPSS